MSNIDIKLVLNRIKEQKNFQTDIELAEFLGMKQSTFSRWKSKIYPNLNYIIEKGNIFDLNYIFYGSSRHFSEQQHIRQIEEDNKRTRQALKEENRRLRKRLSAYTSLFDDVFSRALSDKEFVSQHHDNLSLFLSRYDKDSVASTSEAEPSTAEK